jgi:predicted nucleotidyltransferase
MHPRLRRIFEQSVEVFRSDPRVVAAWMFGSAGKETEDAFSDVDPVFLVRDEHFDAVHRELHSIFSRLCPEIVLWWNEGYNDDVKNYAILYDVGDELLQYDVDIMKESTLMNSFGRIFWRACRPEQILFDKAGALTAAVKAKVPESYSPERLRWMIERYWLFAFIEVKYLCRKDLYKLLYAQGVMFDTHMQVLHALHKDADWSWWAQSVKRYLPKGKQGELLAYFGATDVPAIIAAQRREIDAFAADARAACQAWSVEYPELLEARVREHIARHVQG